jgi:branched-chain amino acid transport system ATP-binding protein
VAPLSQLPLDANRGPRAGAARSSRPEVEVEGLSFRVGGAHILSDVSFSVAQGELLGIIGPNGAGKTTLFNLLTGLLRPSGGKIRCRGRDITEASPARRAQLGMGRTFQTSLIFAGLPVLENVRLAAAARPLEAHGALSWGRWWRRPGAKDPSSRSARDALAAVGLSELAAAPAGALSHGDKRKLELAVLLASGAEVLLLDEPMAGVNAEDVDELSALIARLHREGRTVLLVEHHMAVVLGLADRVAVLHHGRLLACGQPAAVVEDPTVQDAYLGEPL